MMGKHTLRPRHLLTAVYGYYDILGGDKKVIDFYPKVTNCSFNTACIEKSVEKRDYGVEIVS